MNYEEVQIIIIYFRQEKLIVEWVEINIHVWIKNFEKKINIE
jgi:hypothetical protein